MIRTQIKFIPSTCQYIVQTREDSQWFWRTCRMRQGAVISLINEPVYFGSLAEAEEFIEKMSLNKQ